MTGYRRFRLDFPQVASATVATIATDRPAKPGSVADVATVAASHLPASTILASYRLLLEAATRGSVERQIRVVERFLDQHLSTAVRLGWTEEELFGCHPDRAFASIRYDCMGAVTIAALTHCPIGQVTSGAIRGENGLASRRPLPCRLSKPVWLVFPPG